MNRLLKYKCLLATNANSTTGLLTGLGSFIIGI